MVTEKLQRRLLELLKEKGITQSELAEKINVRKSVINDILKGRNNNPSFHRMMKIADALGVSLDEFR